MQRANPRRQVQSVIPFGSSPRARALRRVSTILAALAGLLAVAACRDSTPPTTPTTPRAVLDRIGPANATAGIGRELAPLRRRTAPFHAFEQARAAGYDQALTPCWYFGDQGAMGYHYGNPSLIDGRPDLLAPEVLVYEPRRNGSLRLVALEYLVPIAAWTGGEPPTLLGRSFARNDALGLYTLHIWLWRDNPDGLFADWNPRVTCEHAAESEDRAP